ncbi:hypothetical protein AIOL_001863 [Candidatus Rhodobacter oscarellae]|uniref:Uncharacterized protein n=1 Tax=Candidatus Rhodobacter oscarellae TaxID=1675527 RepID=A0A0J9E210_9RHOB|nr:hypothetical protein [Candidatus Rhodobacter lobularis]KMW56906.1 hypothetical protein AIOL_001863 [Candidatus Rhodobacter lobularis]
MQFYFDKIDQNRALLIVGRPDVESDTDHLIAAWRFEGSAKHDRQSRVLCVAPNINSDESQIIAVVPLNLRETDQVKIAPVTKDSRFDRTFPPIVINLDASGESYSGAQMITRTAWHVTAAETPELQLESIGPDYEWLEDNPEVISYVSETSAAKLRPGKPLGNIAFTPRIRITTSRIDLPDDSETESEVRSIVADELMKLTLTAQLYDDDVDVGEEFDLHFEHFLASADVCPLLADQEAIRTTQEFEPIRLNPEVSGLSVTRKMVRTDPNGDPLGIGFLDRIAITTREDCVLEYWVDNRLKFQNSHGLLVLCHLGGGRFTQETRKVRTYLHDELMANRNRNLSLLDRVQDNLVMPRESSTQQLSHPLQFACFELCKFLYSTPQNVEIIPYSVDHFIDRPSLFFALKHPKFAEYAEFHAEIQFDNEASEEIIRELSTAILTETLTASSGVLPITVEAWCAIPKQYAWSLYEAVLNGDAVEMIKLGVEFDRENPRIFLKQFARNKDRLAKLTQDKGSPARILAVEAVNEFQPLTDRLAALLARDHLWDTVEKIALQAGKDSKLFVNKGVKNVKRPRSGVSELENDISILHEVLREHVRKKTADTISRILSEQDKEGEFDLETTKTVIQSWFVNDHVQDFSALQSLLDRLSISTKTEDLVETYTKNGALPHDMSVPTVKGSQFHWYEREVGTALAKELLDMLKQRAAPESVT